MRQRWALGYAFVTRDTVEAHRELAEAQERIVGGAEGDAVADVAFFATMYHAGKLRSNFSFDEMHRFLESDLALKAGFHREEPVFLALQAFAGLGSRIVSGRHALVLLERAWSSPSRGWPVVDLCLNGLWVAAPFDAPPELLRDKALEAVARYPNAHLAHFRLARGHSVCGDHDAAWDSIQEALRLLPAIGTRGSHKLLQEQYVRERDHIHNDRRRARTDEEGRRRLERQEEANHELRQSMESSTLRSIEAVTLFALAITFALGALQITLPEGLGLGERALLMGELGAFLLVFALVIVSYTRYATRPRPPSAGGSVPDVEQDGPLRG